MNTTERIAVVTGAGTGIGQAAAVALMRAGWTVVLSGRRKEPLEQTAALGPPGASFVTTCDVSDSTAVEALF